MKNLLNSSFRLLEKNSSKLPEQSKAGIKGILAMREKIDAVLKKIAEKKISAPKIRIHGDYNLGQVLFTGNDFMIIDFEGEPARMIEERRLKRSPLRDAAGMIRSFHYAVYNSLKTHPAVRAGDNEYLIPWADSWFKYVSEKFTSAYLDTAAGGGFIPDDKNDLDNMLNVFIVEKALYEISYEINNRPEWLGVAIDGLKQAMKNNV
jgi:maltose alpha-D-glucosyltransferase/alpha-amylase